MQKNVMFSYPNTHTDIAPESLPDYVVEWLLWCYFTFSSKKISWWLLKRKEKKMLKKKKLNIIQVCICIIWCERARRFKFITFYHGSMNIYLLTYQQNSQKWMDEYLKLLQMVISRWESSRVIRFPSHLSPCAGILAIII